MTMAAKIGGNTGRGLAAMLVNHTVLLAVGLLGIVAMMILPVPAVVLDLSLIHI